MWHSEKLGKGFGDGNHWREVKLKQIIKILKYAKSSYKHKILLN